MIVLILQLWCRMKASKLGQKLAPQLQDQHVGER
jgi:hypothetical protein